MSVTKHCICVYKFSQQQQYRATSMPDFHSIDGDEGEEEADDADGLCEDDEDDGQGEGECEEDEDGQPILRGSRRVPHPAPPPPSVKGARSALSPLQSSTSSSGARGIQRHLLPPRPPKKKRGCYERHKRPGLVIICIIFIVLREGDSIDALI